MIDLAIRWTGRLTQLFNKHLWNTYYVVGTILGNGNLTLNRGAKVLSLWNLGYSVAKKNNYNKIKKQTKTNMIKNVWTWTSHLIFLCLGFPICKTKMLIVSTSQGGYKDTESQYHKRLWTGLAHSNHYVSINHYN